MCLDFVTLQEPAAAGGLGSGGPGGGALKLWVVDVVLGVTPSLMAFQLFDFLTGKKVGWGRVVVVVGIVCASVGWP